jgi:hypothetical protein
MLKMANNTELNFSSASETYSTAETIFAELPSAFESMMVKLHYFTQFNQHFGQSLAILKDALEVPNAIFCYSKFGLRLKDEALLNRKQFYLLQTKSKLQQTKEQHAATLAENPIQTAVINQLSDEITALDSQLKQLYTECISLEQKLTAHDKDTLVSNFGLASHQTTHLLMELDCSDKIHVLKIASSHFLSKSLLLCEQILDKIVWPTAGVVLNVLELVLKHVVPILTIINESKSLLQDGKSLLVSLGNLYKTAKQKDSSQEARIDFIKAASKASFDSVQCAFRITKISVAIAGTVLLMHPATASAGAVINAVAGLVFTSLSLGITAIKKKVEAQITTYASKQQESEVHTSHISKPEPLKTASFYNSMCGFFSLKAPHTRDSYSAQVYASDSNVTHNNIKC